MDVYGVPAEYYVPAVESFRTYQNNPDLFLDDFAAANAGDQAALERYENATLYSEYILGAPHIEQLLPLTEAGIRSRIDNAYAEGNGVAAFSYEAALINYLGLNTFEVHDFQGASGAVLAGGAVATELIYRIRAGRTGRIVDGSRMTTEQALSKATDYLGPGYQDKGNGRFLSADGLRQVRMGNSDITGGHGGGPHINFEKLRPNPAKPGKMEIQTNIHIYLIDP